MSESRRVLLLEIEDGRTAELGVRLRGLGFSPLWAHSPQEALQLLENSAWRVSAMIVPPDLPVPNLPGALAAMRQAGGGIPILVEGDHPGDEQLAALRRAGLDSALWAPYDDVLLRFQVNSALAPMELGSERRGRRVPSGFPARIAVSGRAKDATLYSVSETGAYLETPRPTVPGTRVRLQVPRLAGPAPITGRVVFANVPGNLQKGNLALGMAVVFHDLTRDVVAQIERYVSDRSRALAL